MNRARTAILVVVGVSLVGLVVVGTTTLVALDGDGVPAVTELQRGTDPLVTDTDGDGLDDGREAELGTDPAVTDTDGDGIADAEEVREYGTDPTANDTDGDGLPDPREVAGPTDATVADTDDDGLEDGPEINEYSSDPTDPHSDDDGISDGTEVHEYGSDPTSRDTDGDGLTDGVEVTDHGTDPARLDTDGDGLDDRREVHGPTDATVADTDDDGLEDGPEINEYNSDPTAAHSDDDGISDGTEVHEHGTDPTQVDTDGDDLTDPEEINEYPTDPVKSDTDGDGLDDRFELQADLTNDTDPLRKDVLVELDYMEGHRPPQEALDTVVRVFANAPVENPDGSTGIDLHIVVDEAIPHDEETLVGNITRLVDEHFDRKLTGYRHAIVLDDVRREARDDLTGFALYAPYARPFVFEVPAEPGPTYEPNQTASLFMHELGHSMGLTSRVYEGIDSYNDSYDDYTSAMNYMAPNDAVEYNTGEPFDDWAFLAAEIVAPSTRLGVTPSD